MRRRALALGACLLLAGSCHRGAAPDAGTSGDAAGASDAAGALDAAAADATAAADAGPAADPLAGAGAVTLVAGGFMFVEGPQWVASRGTLLFSDIPGDTIYELTPGTGAVAPFRTPSGNSNGLGLTPDGRLLAAEHGNRRVSVSDLGGPPAALADAYMGAALNSPNDVVARSDGTVYFTDPPYGITDAQRELSFMGVFRVPAPGAPVPDPVAEWMGDLLARPNGIGLSPDESVLYVSDTDAGVVRAFDVAAGGALGVERVLSADVPGADGLAVDAAGNLFVATSAGIRALSPDGATWGTLAVPEQPANCAFGDADARTLYITARTSLYQVRLAGPGLPTH
ncbi:MAG TPA: SMP-30/gluconolactonase/LRE family protein [Myxococcota bacterium]|nr:SMP-30/gluconolactonase/LRE family protein [Myxococcota bacterium]